MQARAHLKLIVSDSAHEAHDDDAQDRMSMVQPLSVGRSRRQWLGTHLSAVALWSASAILLLWAGLVALGWL